MTLLFWRIIVSIVCGVMFFTVGLTWLEQLTNMHQTRVKNLSSQKNLDIKDSLSFVQSLSIVKLFVYVRTALYMLIFIHVYDLFKGILNYTLNKDRSAYGVRPEVCIRIYGVVR